MSDDKSGFVYVMTKESSPSYFKIGRTEKKPQLRAMELDGTDSPTPSIVVYYVFCEDIDRMEICSHQALDSFRVRQNREWFRCSQQEAVDAIKRTADLQGIEIYYEKNLIQMNASSDSHIAEDDAEVDVLKEIIDSIFYSGGVYQGQVNKYQRFLDDRLRELECTTGDSKARSMAKAAFAAKEKDLRTIFVSEAKFLIERERNNFGDDAINKLYKLVEDIANKEISAAGITDQQDQAKQHRDASKRIDSFLANLGKD